LITKTSLVLNSQNQIPVVIGGSRDLKSPCFDALLANSAGKPCVLIDINPSLDAESLFEGSLIHEQSSLTHIFTNPQFKASNSKIICFGTNAMCSEENAKKIIENGGEIIFLKQIRESKIKSVSKTEGDDFGLLTQAGQMFKELLDSLKDFRVYISVNLESIEVF
jgi:arginase family enzyme